MKKIVPFIFLLLVNSGLSAQEESPLPSKQQIIYLAQARDSKEALSLYRTYKKQLGRHDFEVLQQIASVILEQSAKSTNPEKQILGLFGYSIGGLSAPPNLLSSALASSDIQLQLAAIQYLGRMQEDYADTLLNKAMSSDFLFTRLEAAFILSMRKAKSATGQIESLMYRIPPQLRSFFPEFFAIIGTSEAIHILRHLMDDSFHPTRIAAILSAAHHGRDDLLPPIRAAATHLNSAEQEACATALGYLKDMKSIKKLKRLTNNSSPMVKLAALHSLFLLGDDRAAGKIALEAQNENVFAISLLGEIPGQEEVLVPLLSHSNIQIRFNAAFALLQRKDPRSVPVLLEFLMRDSRDLGFQPHSSTGNSMRAWKVISSSSQKTEDSFYDIRALTVAVKELILTESLQLPESDFLTLSHKLLSARETELVPRLVSLLETQRSPAAIDLLKKYSITTGAPLIRTYCNLALLRLGEPGPYKEIIKDFVKDSRSHQLIRFRSSLPWNVRIVENPHTLTPEESSSLLIHSYETLSREQDEEAIDFLLEAIELGNIENRPVLAGILLHTLH